MTSYTITLSGDEHSEVIIALRSDAHDRRSLAAACEGIESLAKSKTKFQEQADRLDALALKITLAEADVS